MFEEEAKKHKEHFVSVALNLGLNLSTAETIGTQKEESFREGAEFGFNKANKWHHVKNDKYPEQTEDPVIVELYCLYKAAKRTELHFGYYSFEDKHWYELYNDNEPVDYEVIAWKEAILPEEAE